MIRRIARCLLAAGAVIALNELWYRGINGLMLRAATQVRAP
ncbi:MAG: hypothetical protein WCK40_01535 [Thermoleophilia bacterium]